MNKRTLSVLFSITFAVVFLASCSKDPASFTFNSKLRVVHASPNAPAVNVFLNGRQILSGVTYPTASGYVTTPSGFNVIQVTAGSDTVISARPELLFDYNYTVFAVDTVQRITPLVVIDNLNLPTAAVLDTTALVRFFHLAPGAPNVTVGRVSGSDTTALFANRPFTRTLTAAQQTYTSVTPGNFNLVVRNVAGTQVLLNIGNVTLEAGKAYTIYARGFTGQPLSHGVLVYDYRTD